MAASKSDPIDWVSKVPSQTLNTQPTPSSNVQNVQASPQAVSNDKPKNSFLVNICNVNKRSSESGKFSLRTRDSRSVVKKDLIVDSGAAESIIGLPEMKRFLGDECVEIVHTNCCTKFVGVGNKTFHCTSQHARLNIMNEKGEFTAIDFHVCPFSQEPLIGNSDFRVLGIKVFIPSHDLDDKLFIANMNTNHLSDSEPCDDTMNKIEGDHIANPTTYTLDGWLNEGNDIFFHTNNPEVDEEDDELDDDISIQYVNHHRNDEREKVAEQVAEFNKDIVGPSTFLESIYYPKIIAGTDLRLIHDNQPPITGEKLVFLREWVNSALENKWIDIVPQEFFTNPVIKGLPAPNLVVKKGEKFRNVVNVKQINEKIQVPYGEFSTFDSIISKFRRGNLKYITGIDLKSAYNSCPYLSFDQWEKNKIGDQYIYLYFYADNIRYYWKVMPFGIRDAPFHFCSTMKKLFDGFESVDFYVDDMILTDAEKAKHIQNVLMVAKLLSDHNFKISMEKCKFLADEMKFLGCIINANGYHADPVRIHEIMNTTIPKTQSQLASYVGAIEFVGRFMVNKTELMIPLYDIKSDPAIKKIFNQDTIDIIMKQMKTINVALANIMSLSFFNINDHIFVFTDASGRGLGGTIGYWGKGQMINVIDMYSRTFSKAEMNYSIFRKELLAIFACIKRWYKILSFQQFTIRCDNLALCSVLSGNEPVPGKVEERWCSVINSLPFRIMHVKGVDNPLADYLSRNPLSHINKNICSNIYSVSIPYITPPLSERSDIVAESHGDHAGYAIMKERIMSNGTNWNGMVEDCKKHVAVCLECLSYNPQKRKFHNQSCINAVSPFEHIVIDLAGPFVTSHKGNKYVLVYVCAFSSFVVYTPIEDKKKDTIVFALAEIFCTWGAPKVIQSDNGGEFSNDLVQEMMDDIRTQYRFSAAYKPKSNGKAEIKVCEFKKILEKSLFKKPSAQMNWDLFVKYIQFMINSRVCRTTKCSPFYLIFSRLPMGVLGNVFDKHPMFKLLMIDWHKNQNHLLDQVYKQANDNKAISTSYDIGLFKDTHMIDQGTIPIGTKVMVEHFSPMRPMFRRKFDGPFVVHEIVDNNRFYILKTNDEDGAAIIKRKFARESLKIVHPDTRFGTLQAIISVLEQVKLPSFLDEEDDNDYYTVRFLDVELEDEIMGSDLINEVIFNEFKSKYARTKKFPVHLNKNTIKVAYGLNDDDLKDLSNDHG